MMLYALHNSALTLANLLQLPPTHDLIVRACRLPSHLAADHP